MQPVLMNFKDLNACVVGFGVVGRHKAKQLYEEGAIVYIVDPKLSEQVVAHYQQYHFIQKSYSDTQLDQMDVVVAATSDEQVNQCIAQDAKARHLLCSVSDNGAAGTFTWMSVVKRGSLSIGISTEHKFPGMTKRVRMMLEDQFPLDYGDYINYMAEKRVAIKALSPEEKDEAMGNLLELTYDLYKQGRENSEN